MRLLSRIISPDFELQRSLDEIKQESLGGVKMALGFILGALFTFLFLFIPAVLSINPREDEQEYERKNKEEEK